MEPRPAKVRLLELIAPSVSSDELRAQLNPEHAKIYFESLVPVEKVASLLRVDSEVNDWRGTVLEAIEEQHTRLKKDQSLDAEPLKTQDDLDEKKDRIIGSLINSADQELESVSSAKIRASVERPRKVMLLQSISKTLENSIDPPNSGIISTRLLPEPERGEINILRLLPGGFGDRIECELSLVRLDEAPHLRSSFLHVGSSTISAIH
jgi:hypothetical protein